MSFQNLICSVCLLLFLFFSCESENPVVIFKTDVGEFAVEIYTDRAPVTAENFLKYVRENRFTDAVFYRVVREDNQPENKIKIDVIQGGLFKDDHPLSLAPIGHESTIETGILHLDGMISMARHEPGTASSEFFICVGDQPELDFGGRRNSDGQGFAAFGRVIDGMTTVKAIHQQNANGQYLDPQIKIKSILQENIL